MPQIFSYGSLQEEEVQLSTFGRLLQGERDELPGFELAWVKITDPQIASPGGRTHYANAVFNGRDDSRVAGTAFEVTHAELATADRYEQLAGYMRCVVMLASGRRAWVYVDARQAAGGSSAPER